MPVSILIPTALRPYTGGSARVEVDGDTVGAALGALTTAYPPLARHLRTEEGALRSFVNVYLGEEDIRFLDREATALEDGAELTIVPSIAGGTGTALPTAPPTAAPTAAPSLPVLTPAELRRYSRHLILDEVGVEGQRKLKASSVLCVGTGGLGAPLLLYLAAAGVGRIGICDFDVVEESNLQRQVVHGTAAVGTSKVASAATRIRDLNPHVELDLHETRLTSENALDLLRGYDVIVDGTDNFPTRYLVNDACCLLGKPNVYGSIFKFEGQATVFNHEGGPNYRDLYPEPPPPGLVPSCAEGGVLGILPAVIGSIQATETVKILLGVGETLSGRLLLFDALRMRFRELRIRRHPDTPPIRELVDYQEFCGLQPPEDEPVQPFSQIPVDEAAARLAKGWAPYLLDVRQPFEAEIASLPGTDRLVPHTRVQQIAAELPTDRDILVYCKSGGRSAFACQVLAGAGHTRLFNLAGGIRGWAQRVDPSLAIY